VTGFIKFLPLVLESRQSIFIVVVAFDASRVGEYVFNAGIVAAK
jgi:hypothetical protein